MKDGGGDASPAERRQLQKRATPHVAPLKRERLLPGPSHHPLFPPPRAKDAKDAPVSLATS